MSDAERIRYHRTPKAVLRALMRAQGDGEAAPRGKVSLPYEKAQILQWINAAAPIAASKLIEQVSGNDKELAHKAAVAILQWCIGRPHTGEVNASIELPGDRKIEIVIKDPAMIDHDEVVT